jgi:hypothetical protein
MDNDILDIRILPPWSPSSVLRKLTSTISKSQILQAGIAYWTINDDIFGPQLARALSDPSSFLCVDLHAPTEIDALEALVKKGARIYWFCWDIPTYTDSGRRDPPRLLHTKMLLFWGPDRTMELWIGSHNWTNRALAGLNIECSIVVRARDTSSLCADAAHYLHNIKQICNQFDPAKVDFYKQIQHKTKKEIAAFIDLEGKDAKSLGNLTIALFVTDQRDERELDTVGSDVYLKVIDSDSTQEYHYPAQILHAGRLSAPDPSAGGIFFTPRRYAFRRGRRFPVLLPEQEIGFDVLNETNYFVTLKIKAVDTTIVTEETSAKTAAWVDVPEEENVIFRRLDPEARNLLFRRRRASSSNTELSDA